MAPATSLVELLALFSVQPQLLQAFRDELVSGAPLPLCLCLSAFYDSCEILHVVCWLDFSLRYIKMCASCEDKAFMCVPGS